MPWASSSSAFLSLTDCTTPLAPAGDDRAAPARPARSPRPGSGAERSAAADRAARARPRRWSCEAAQGAAVELDHVPGDGRQVQRRAPWLAAQLAVGASQVADQPL